MQPLYSVEHETRHNTHHVEEENVERAEESTPLLHRFPQAVADRSTVTTVIVSLLLIVLISGVIIGIYLLVLQDDSENVLPPVENPLQLVSRSQWDPSNVDQSALRSFPYRLRAVTVVHTGTEQCNSTETCTKLLLEMQSNAAAANSTLRYNFLISSNGQTYEDLGWLKCIQQSTKNIMPTGLLLAFIGNFTETPPTRRQLQEAKNFFAASESQQYLHPSYRIFEKYCASVGSKPRHEEEGRLASRKRSGRPQLMNEAQPRPMVSEYENSGFIPIRHFAELFDTSMRTFPRALHAEGLHHRSPAQKPYLTKKHKQIVYVLPENT